MFTFIKAISDTVFDMINTVYHDNPLIFIRAMFREKLVFFYSLSDSTAPACLQSFLLLGTVVKGIGQNRHLYFYSVVLEFSCIILYLIR